MQKKTKDILKIIGIAIIFIITILVTSFFAYRIGKIDMYDKIIDCADRCDCTLCSYTFPYQKNIDYDCFKTCIWHATHDIGFIKIG